MVLPAAHPVLIISSTVPPCCALLPLLALLLCVVRTPLAHVVLVVQLLQGMLRLVK